MVHKSILHESENPLGQLKDGTSAHLKLVPLEFLLCVLLGVCVQLLCPFVLRNVLCAENVYFLFDLVFFVEFSIVVLFVIAMRCCKSPSWWNEDDADRTLGDSNATFS